MHSTLMSLGTLAGPPRLALRLCRNLQATESWSQVALDLPRITPCKWKTSLGYRGWRLVRTLDPTL